MAAAKRPSSTSWLRVPRATGPTGVATGRREQFGGLPANSTSGIDARATSASYAGWSRPPLDDVLVGRVDPERQPLVEALAARGGQLQRARPMRQTPSRGRWRSVLRGVGVPARAPSTAGLNGSIQWDSSPLAVVVRIERGFEILAGVVRTCAGPDILEPGSCGTASDDSNRSMPCWSDTSPRWSDGPEARRRSGSAASRHHERGRGRAG